VRLFIAQESTPSPEACGSWSWLDVPFVPGWHRAEFDAVAMASDGAEPKG
jgi:hypothetical protein